MKVDSQVQDKTRMVTDSVSIGIYAKVNKSQCEFKVESSSDLAYKTTVRKTYLYFDSGNYTY